MNNRDHGKGSSASKGWRTYAVLVAMMIVPWVLYTSVQSESDMIQAQVQGAEQGYSASLATAISHGDKTEILHKFSDLATKVQTSTKEEADYVMNKFSELKSMVMVHPNHSSATASTPLLSHTEGTSTSRSMRSSFSFPELPVLGPIPGDNSAKPLYGVKHKGTDAIFALACNYPKLYYQRFVGTLRDAGFTDDVVLAVSPEEKMKPGVKEYIKEAQIVAYGFDVDCRGKDDCRLRTDFLGHEDPRPHRTFANIRYALYEFWLRVGGYSENSYILILDFRDTFFQAHPFQNQLPFNQRSPQYDLQMYAENAKVKWIGNCVFNSMWVGRCFGKPALKGIQQNPVICSGSTLGSYPAIHYYIRTMLASMDKIKCWLKGIESDQGYQNYLFYNGHFNTEHGNATLNQQGYGIVNTIGALNGFRVPKEMKGPLDTWWKIKDKEGFILNYDGTRSATVHQWDRWHDEVAPFLDKQLVRKHRLLQKP